MSPVTAARTPVVGAPRVERFGPVDRTGRGDPHRGRVRQLVGHRKREHGEPVTARDQGCMGREQRQP
ncbi:hypothetical protein ACFRQM_33455 [Streptomyces sp. NPDC056831]|uniref:hypothetical protein n=1 Tax=Streptomyces sp. NPDC056831 TaxID=3345954 RepID=UPI003692C37D